MVSGENTRLKLNTMSTQTHTPLADAQEFLACDGSGNSICLAVEISFARDLERKNAALVEALEFCENLLANISQITQPNRVTTDRALASCAHEGASKARQALELARKATP